LKISYLVLLKIGNARV